MSEQTLVYSDKFYNASETTDAVVEVNGGPLRVLIPSTAQGNAGYVELYGDYTSFQVITAGVTVAVMAFG
jgi:hypothetical protein